MADIEIEEIKNEDQDDEKAEKKPITELNDKSKQKLPLGKRIKAFFKNPKKRLIFEIASGLVLIALVGTGLYFMTKEKPVEKVATTPKPVEAPKCQAPLDGLMVECGTETKHPLGVIVENHQDARPQSGIYLASIVYEAIAEGGITRYLAIFGTNEAEKVGPVRSARTYFVDWINGYNGYFAHVGGNIDALEKIQIDKILDLDQFRYPAAYWREKTNGLASEHTMYTSTIKLRDQASKNQYDTANNFTIYKFKEDPADAEKDALPESQKVSVNYGSAQYNVSFAYEKATNSYKRSINGKADNDKVTKGQINPKNIVVMTVKRTATVTKINEKGYNMTTSGEGSAKMYLDGKVITGTWKKNSADEREIFYDEAGAEVVFNRGQFWICVIPPDGSVTVD